jgi:type IV secretion system protein VirD4
MTRPISASSWVKPALIGGGVLVLAALALQVAGLVFCGVTGAALPQDVTPYTIYQYWYWYGKHPIWQSYLYASAAAGALALLVPVGFVLAPGRRRKLHGDARWARGSEVRRARLLGTQGIIVGKLGGKFLMFDGTEQGKNVMVAASPGSGKTQGVMIPNCLNWPGSLVGLDIKGECYARTAGFRASMGQEVYQLNFLSREYRTHQYDPFGYVSSDKNFRVADIEKIANYLSPNPPPPTDPFWAIGARDMFRAVALYLLDTGQPCTLGTVLDTVETPEELQTFAKRIVKESGEGKLALDPQSVRDFAKIANRPDKTHGGVKDQLTAALAPLKNPLVRFATSANTFDLRELRAKRMSIYLTVARPDLTPLQPIVKLFFQHLVDLNSMVEYGKDPSHKHEVLLAMDEFAQLGRLDAIFEGVTFFRSFGMRLLAILQSPSQNRTNYSVEGAKTFEQSFDCSVFYTPAARDIETAELVSRLLGNQTVKGKSESKRKGFETRHDSTSTSDHKRALMLPQEVLRMSLDKQIILISGVAPIYANKVRAWKEPALLARGGEAPVPAKMDIGQAVIDISNAVEVLADRPIESADMAQLDELTLTDFSCDFSAIDVPEGKMTEIEIANLRDRFLDTLVVAA